MTTITINISEQAVVDDYAKLSGYLAVSPLTGVPNPQTATEFVKDKIAKNICDTVCRLRSKQAVADAISTTENLINSKIT